MVKKFQSIFVAIICMVLAFEAQSRMGPNIVWQVAKDLQEKARSRGQDKYFSPTLSSPQWAFNMRFFGSYDPGERPLVTERDQKAREEARGAEGAAPRVIGGGAGAGAGAAPRGFEGAGDDGAAPRAFAGGGGGGPAIEAPVVDIEPAPEMQRHYPSDKSDDPHWNVVKRLFPSANGTFGISPNGEKTLLGL